jgi:hypothetical protein
MATFGFMNRAWQFVFANRFRKWLLGLALVCSSVVWSGSSYAAGLHRSNQTLNEWRITITSDKKTFPYTLLQRLPEQPISSHFLTAINLILSGLVCVQLKALSREAHFKTNPVLTLIRLHTPRYPIEGSSFLSRG